LQTHFVTQNSSQQQEKKTRRTMTTEARAPLLHKVRWQCFFCFRCSIRFAVGLVARRVA